MRKKLFITLTIFLFTLTTYSQSAKIHFVGEPEVSVYLNSEFMGKITTGTEGLIIENLEAGNYLIKLTKNGFLPLKDNITVKENEEMKYMIKQSLALVRTSTDPEHKSLFVVEDMASFQGKGQSAFQEWVKANLQYPAIAKQKKIEGTVYVQFTVMPDGKVTKVQVVHGVDPTLDKEAVRLILSSPQWTPAKQRGKPVEVNLTIPIEFKLK